MVKEDIQKKILSKIDELPTLPVVIPKLISLIENPNSNANDLSNLISHDPALTSKILKVSNSAYYGFSQKISALEHAVALLGFNMVKSLALSIGVINFFPSENKSNRFSHEGLWLHCVAVATILQEIGKRFSKSDSNQSSFVIGLLHDIGQIVLDQFYTDQFNQALEYADKHENTKLHIAERTVIGIDHCEVASILLKKWKFPDEIINPIEYHHDAEIPENVDMSTVAMLRLADILAHELYAEDAGAYSLEIEESVLYQLNIKEADLNDIRSYSSQIKDGIHAFFSAVT